MVPRKYRQNLMKRLILTITAVFLPLGPRSGGESVSVVVGPALEARGAAAADSTLEYRVKAAFLYNFTRFVEWPPLRTANESAPLVIGVLGEDPFGETLDKTVSGKRVKGRSVEVERFESEAGIERCHVLFVSGSESDRLPLVLNRLEGLPVLIVGESKDFIEHGGAVRLFRKDGRVQFEISLDASDRAQLQISARLLKVADRIIGHATLR